MKERACIGLRSVFEAIDGVVDEEDSVAFADGIEINPQSSGNGEGFIPDGLFLSPVVAKIRGLLLERQSLVPRLRILFLHRRNQIIGCFNLVGVRRTRNCYDQSAEKQSV